MVRFFRNGPVVDDPAVIAVIVLAAGGSSRMGRSKLLLEVEGESLLRRAARCAAEAAIGPAIVVLGAEAERARRELEGLPCVAVEDSGLTSRGMNGSLAAGVRALPEGVRGAVVLLADMPFVTAAHVRALAERHRATGAPLVVTRHGAALAPPVLYDEALLPELAAGGDGDGRGRELIRRHRERAELVDAPAAALEDVDLPADLSRVRARLRAGGAR
jgi:molybdenum cofactor cytidylyltransferase